MRTTTPSACLICSGERKTIGIAEKYELRALGGRSAIDFAICGECRFMCRGNVLQFGALMTERRRIRRACAQSRAGGLIEDAAEFVWRNERRQNLQIVSSAKADGRWTIETGFRARVACWSQVSDA